VRLDQEAATFGRLCRVEYDLENGMGVKNAWESSITTVTGPPFTDIVFFESLSDVPSFLSTSRSFTFELPAGTTSVRLRFSGRQVCS
jgi:hypothetical protein